MPLLNDAKQHERILTTLNRGIRDLRFNSENRSLVIARVNAVSRLARICAQFGKDARFTQLCDTLQKALPGQIGLLKSDINSNVIVADALERMILQSSLFPRPVAVVDKPDGKVDKDANGECSDDEGEMDPSDDNYIARLLLGSKWAKEIVDVPEEPYRKSNASDKESEIDPSDDAYIARLLLGPSWATPVADFAEEPYGGKGALGK
ncbi:hypothetical protein N7536_012458 [Penicillium majusculum]|uniref:Uncharacterized protein n=1 Tax=Penicillium solitum TaxID=60172 RepID=A0A1V6QRB4_9EURO|nr:uncharacterized protein PENSOL_c052G04080 [Penicillium solitum]KAJ5676286.1 hypothetical protein N7536_012458 [Penicillium majusculum]OQD91537.1 hypothetical protein PENSOL_c052G04080 [Penicillium solitum]